MVQQAPTRRTWRLEAKQGVIAHYCELAGPWESDGIRPAAAGDSSYVEEAWTIDVYPFLESKEYDSCYMHSNNT